MQPQPFFPCGLTGAPAGGQQVRPTQTAAAAAAAHVPVQARAAMQPQPPPLFPRTSASAPPARAPPPMFGAPLALPPSFILAAPPPARPMNHVQTALQQQMQPPQPQPQPQPQPPRLNGLSSRTMADRDESDSSDSDTDLIAPSNRARQQLRQNRPRSKPKIDRSRMPQPTLDHSRDDFKSAQPSSAHVLLQHGMHQPGSSTSSSGRSSHESSARGPPVAASAAVAVSSSVPSAVPSPTFNFRRALPPINLADVAVPPGYTPRTADVVIIGAGAAGLQCAELLSKLSPLTPDGASADSPSHSLSILIIEGRERIGGRVFSEQWSQGNSKIVVEHGAAFIHGCDSSNLAFRTAVKYGMRRFIKNDFNDGWYRGGRRLDPDHAISLRHVVESIEAIMLREAKAVLQQMRVELRSKKEEVKTEAVKMEEGNEEGDEAAAEDDEAEEEQDDEAQSDVIKREMNESPVLSASSASSGPGGVNAASSVSVASPVVKLEAFDPFVLEPAASDSDSDDDSFAPPPPVVKTEFEDAAAVRSNIAVKIEPKATNSSSDSDSDVDSNSGAKSTALMLHPLPTSTLLAPAAASAVPFSDMPALERALVGSATSANRLAVATSDLARRPSATVKQENCREDKPAVGVNHSSSSFSSSSFNSSSSSSDSSERDASKSPRGRKRKVESASSASDASAIDLTSSPPPPRSQVRPAAKRRQIQPSDDAMQPAVGVVAGLSCSASATSASGPGRPKMRLQIGAETPMLTDDDEGENHWSPQPLAKQQSPALEAEEPSDESDFPKKRRHKHKHGRRVRDSSPESVGSALRSLRKAHRKKREDLKRFQEALTQTSPGSVSSKQAGSDMPAKPKREGVRFVPKMDRSLMDVFKHALDEYKAEHKLSEEDEQIVMNIATSQFGYVGEMSKLSVADLVFTCGATGGERSLVGGFQSVLSKLHHRCVRRSKCDQCYFQVLHERTVSVIEQPHWLNQAADELPLVVCHVPAKKELYVSHFVVSTASIGIMQASLQRNVELAPKVAPQLGQNRERCQSPYHLPTEADGGAIAPCNWKEKQLEAAMVFVPPLSHSKVEAFMRMGMGCENKVILQFAPGARFWPRSLHVLRGTGVKQWRFYSLGGIRGDDCNILIAHLPPPMSRAMEDCKDEEILNEVMGVLRVMFTGQRNVQEDDDDSPRRYLPPSTLVNGNQEWTLYDDHHGDASDDVRSSSDDDPDLHRRRQQHKRELNAFRAREQIDDGEWRSKPVVRPIKFHVTRWAQDPFALGAYSFVPRGCQLGVMSKRLQDAEPPTGPSGDPAAAGGLYFAGEGTSSLDSQQVHGAMASGVRAANCIADRIKRHMALRQKPPEASASGGGHPDTAAAAVIPRP